MLELLLALVADPPASAAVEVPPRAQAGDLAVGNGGMMAWSTGGALGGQITVVVDNAGAETDRIVSINTPSGTVGTIVVFPIVNGRGERGADGDTSIRPGRTGVLGELTDLTSGVPMPVATTITVVFERAGEVTVSAQPTSPAPPPSSR